MRHVTLEKKMNLSKAVVALGLVAFAAVNGQAAVAAESGWYGGIGIGQSKAKIDHERIDAQLGGAVTSFDDDDRGIGFKLFAGKKFNKNFAVEGGYFNLGNFGFTATTTPGNTLTGKIKLQGVNLDAVGILPFTEKFSGLGRVGLTYAQARDTFSTGGTVTISDSDPKKSGANLKIGLGVQYDFTRSLGLRGEWERYRVNDAVGNKGDIHMLLVGLVYTFGVEKPKPPARRAATSPPPKVAAAPFAAEPVLVIVPILARTQQYCRILDIQFEINQKTVQHEYQEKVDRIASFMKKYPDTTALIEGHSDEVGTAADNMALSVRRAEGVVTYLVDRGGIARSRLRAVGYGETRPIADNLTEEGKRANRRINAIIACATDIEGIVPIADRITMALEMEFDALKADVRPQYREELRKVANFLKANPRVTATVEGHTGNLQATAALAMEMSQRRAQNVLNYLVNEFGVDRMQLFAEGFGATRRFAYNTSLEGQQDNRRVNIILDFPK
jgi:OOP family OmpA-OmpF porin